MGNAGVTNLVRWFSFGGVEIGRFEGMIVLAKSSWNIRYWVNFKKEKDGFYYWKKHGSKERSLSLDEYGLKYVGSKDVLTCFKIVIKVLFRINFNIIVIDPIENYNEQNDIKVFQKICIYTTAFKK